MALSPSGIIGKLRSHFSRNRACRASVSVLTPITWAFMRLNSGSACSKRCASMLHPGVLALG